MLISSIEAKQSGLLTPFNSVVLFLRRNFGDKKLMYLQNTQHHHHDLRRYYYLMLILFSCE